MMQSGALARTSASAPAVLTAPAEAGNKLQAG
jgi:hypothetical protein